MKIAIDLDGVVFDSERIYFERSSKLEREYQTGFKDEFAVHPQDRYNWSEEQIKDFIHQNVIEVCSTAPFMRGSQETIQKLIKMGHEIVFVTKRGEVIIEEKEITKQRLNCECFKECELVFANSNKLDDCKKLGVDLFIDDLYKNVDSVFSGGIKCIYFNTLSDKHFPKSNTLVHEVSSWQEVMEYFE